ncbi:MAG: serine/threonine protein kinase [Woeseiaceae bacterium]|nr:serine/threonine protein kinase [Woeseiaceae bacterium]
MRRPRTAAPAALADVDATLAYAALDPATIADALASKGFACDGRLLALNSYENRVYRVGIENGAPVVAKFYRPGRWSDAAILEEHAFAAELEAAEIPVVTPLASDGATLHHHGGFRFAVYPCHGGRAPDLDDFDLLRQLGRFVARSHAVGALARFEARPALDIDSFGTASRDYLLEHDVIPPDLLPAYESVADDVLEGIAAVFERVGDTRSLRIHGDFHPGNVLVRDERVHIVDLDDARHGPAVQDLWMFLSGDRAEQEPQLAALLDGYEEFRDFDYAELHLVEALRSLRLMHYAAWLARRWADPAFRAAFPWFESRRYWDEHVLSLREQIPLMQEPALSATEA